MDDIELLKSMYANLALDYARFKILYENANTAKLEILDNLREVINIIFAEESKSRISKEDKERLKPIARKVGRLLD